MSESKHTPGPWKCDERPYFGSWFVRQDPANWDGMGYQLICDCPAANKKGDGHYAEMFAANARLIAAAPELLEALQEYLFAEEIDDAGVRQGELAVARQRAERALAKAGAA